jgi:hypothetical protein
VQSCLPSASAQSGLRSHRRPGRRRGRSVVWAAGLRVRGGTVTAEGRVPSAAEPTVFCRPVVTAPAVVRRDGTVLAGAWLAGAWLPDLVRLGELEAHLGDGVIEAVVDAAVAAGRLKPRQRQRLMSYPLVIRLMLAAGLITDASYSEALARLAGLLADIPLPWSGMSRRRRWSRTGGCRSHRTCWNSCSGRRPGRSSPVTIRRLCCWPGRLRVRRAAHRLQTPGQDSRVIRAPLKKRPVMRFLSSAWSGSRTTRIPSAAATSASVPSVGLT